LGRSIAFASGGFLAFATGGQFIRTSIDAAKEAQVTQKQLGQQLRNDGQSFAAYRGEIDKTGLRLSALSGFTKDALDQALTTILRSTKNVGKALRDEGTAADLARAKHIALSQSALILGKVEAGNTTLLRRQGFQIAKTATAEQALAIVRAKVAGQARAGTTEQQKFGAVLHDSEVIIGAGLLPTLNKYLAQGATWLTQMNESGRLQKDVKNITGDVTHALHDAGRIAKFLAGAFRDLNTVTGSTEHTLEEFAGVWALLRLRTSLIKWGLLRAEIAGVGGSATVATGEIGGLRAGLLALGGPEVLVALAAVADAMNLINDEMSHHTRGHAQTGGPAKLNTEVFEQGGKYFERVTVGRNVVTKQISKAQAGAVVHPAIAVMPRAGSGDDMRGAYADAAANAAAVGKALRQRRGLSLQGRFNLADLALQRAALTAQTSDDKRALLIEAAITREQLAQTKTLKDRTAKTQQLAGILSQVRSIDQGDAQAAKAAAKAARDRAQTLLQTREFKVIGLDATGQPFTPGLRALRRELGNVRKNIAGTSLDTAKDKGILGDVNRLLFGKDAHTLTKDVRSTVKQMLDGIRDELKAGVGDNRTKFHVVNTEKVLAGLGLTPAQVRVARGRLAQLGAGGVAPRAGGAFGVTADGGGMSVTMHNPVFHGVTDVKALENELSKRKKQKSGTRRGRNAGR